MRPTSPTSETARGSRPRPSRGRLPLIPAVVLSAAGLAAGLACGGEPPPAAPAQRAPVVVEIATAALEPVASFTRATGTAEPWRRVGPGTKLMGRIESVGVREGQRVDAGDTLAELESRDLEAAVEQARAALVMARARLENADIHHRRMIDLHERGSVTDKALEDATAAFRVAEAGVEQAEASLTAAGVTLTYTRIVAPLAGWVTEKRVEAGDMASPGMPLFTLEDLSRMKVSLNVPESDVPGVEPGDPVTVSIDVLDRSFDGEVDRVVPSADRGSRTFEVQVIVDNPDGALKSGMFVRARFPRGEHQALRLPESAVVSRGQLDGVFVVDEDGVARLRWIRLGRRSDGRVEVLSGLETGERYLVAPPLQVADGTPVTAR